MAEEDKPGERAGERIQFLLNGDVVLIDRAQPTLTVLRYLREQKRLMGTKEGCAEGDCGACTVVIGELVGGDLELKAVNACIQFLATLDGKALFTVEYLRQEDGGLHPVQQAMVDHHGSQCGFCTPGFIMSLWGVYNAHEFSNGRPDDVELRSALSGNLCRCTGYRPILDAGLAMFDLPHRWIDRALIKKQLLGLKRDGGLSYHHEREGFHAPRTLEELTHLRAAMPEATILAGGTDIGLWVNKRLQDLGDVIFVGEIPELKEIRVHGDRIRIGAAASLSAAYAALVQHYPEVAEMGERFASLPIRNAGTLGGNVANGSPIGDSMPWLITVDSAIILRSRDGVRTVPLDQFYLDYMQKDLGRDEILEAIDIPLPKPDWLMRTYKIAKRFDSDISAVCAAFCLTIENGDITDAKVAFGGMAATARRADNCERALVGSPWNGETARLAAEALAKDYQPLSDLRASAAYRLQVAKNLMRRFYLETQPSSPLAPEELSVFAAKP